MCSLFIYHIIFILKLYYFIIFTHFFFNQRKKYYLLMNSSQPNFTNQNYSACAWIKPLYFVYVCELCNKKTFLRRLFFMVKYMFLLFVSEVRDTDAQQCEQYQVVALGSGQNCCSGWLSYTGSVVHDCHAIVIARRALKRCKDFKQHRCKWRETKSRTISYMCVCVYVCMILW